MHHVVCLIRSKIIVSSNAVAVAHMAEHGDSAAVPATSDELDVFQRVFKALKRREPPADLSGVLDVRTQSEAGSTGVSRFIIEPPGSTGGSCTEPTLTHPCFRTGSWRGYRLTAHAGITIIENPFTPEGQRAWAWRCLCEYPSAANRSNLDAHHEAVYTRGNLWTQYLSSKGGADVALVASRDDRDTRETSTESEKKRRRVCDPLASAHTQKHTVNASATDAPTEPSLLSKLRWVTLGYHHNWDTKRYSQANRSPFPEGLTDLAQELAGRLGYGVGYRAEAAIINYYHRGSTLSGHTDHSELVVAPLFSVSLGCTAIFMIGGSTRDVVPTPLYLRRYALTMFGVCCCHDWFRRVQ